MYHLDFVAVSTPYFIMHYRHTAYRVVRPAQIQQMIVVKVPLAIWKKKTNMFICGFVLMILFATCTTRLICSYPLRYSYSSNDTGFKITAGQQTISGQNGVLTAKSFTHQSCWPVGWRKVTNGNTSVSVGWYNLHSPRFNFYCIICSWTDQFVLFKFIKAHYNRAIYTRKNKTRLT